MVLSITSVAPSTAPCSFCLTRKHSSWSRVNSKKDGKTLTLHTKGTISSLLVLKKQVILMEMDWVLCLGENQTFPQTLCVRKICDLVLTYLISQSPSHVY